MATKLGHGGYATVLWTVADAWLKEDDLPDRDERWVDSARSNAAVLAGDRDETDKEEAVGEAVALVLGACLLLDRASDVLEAADLDTWMLNDLSDVIAELETLLDEAEDPDGSGDQGEVSDGWCRSRLVDELVAAMERGDLTAPWEVR
jgi:hypothetical protein